MTYDQWRAGHTRYDLVAVHYPNSPEHPYNTYYNTWFPIYDTLTPNGALIGQTYNWQKQNRETFEVRLTSKGESRFQWMAGLFYEDVYDWWDYGTELPGLQDDAGLGVCAVLRLRRQICTGTTSSIRSRRPTSTTRTSSTRPSSRRPCSAS